MKIITAGPLGDSSGDLYLSFFPEHGSVSLTASVPSDKRRSDITIRTTLPELNAVLAKLEQEHSIWKAAESRKRLMINSSDEVSLHAGGGRISIPKDSLEEFRELVLEGKNNELITRVKGLLPFLNDEALKDVSLSIYMHFNPRK